MPAHRSPIPRGSRPSSKATGQKLHDRPDPAARVGDLRQPGLGASLTFHCRTLRGAPVRGEPYLVEIRQCVDDDGPGGAPGTLLPCEDWHRVDQGCGRSFHIAEAARQ